LERPGTRPSTQKQTADSKAKAERKKDGNIRRTRMASTDEGHIPALLADICAVKVLADSGADDNVMSHLTARRLSVAGFFMPTKKLESPISLQLTAKEMTVSAVEKSRINITLQLEAGPLRLRNVEFLILDAELEEVLLGRPLMKLLGIDVNDHLNLVRKEFHDRDFSDAPSMEQGEMGTLSRILLN
jgi:predicted aspartyl protease